MSRKEVWLYERIDAEGTIGKHLYAVLSSEHPVGAAGADLAEFVEDVYTSGYRWRRIMQLEATENMNQGKYSYVNFSLRTIKQEWDRPVYANRVSSIPGRPNFLWECFKSQLGRALKLQKQKKAVVK